MAPNQQAEQVTQLATKPQGEAPTEATLTEEHRRQAELLDHLSQQRDPKALRHFLPRDSPRIPEEMTALGFAEKLGYRHAWQALDVPHAPYYSHWSGQLIDHCLLSLGCA
ncbi:Endo/exonuclease/phosphatase domain-containing protein [Durusdinium trenchii]|uniref:Endo/exonuclease/phosphatase domain-containing protein n=1 Tax=Durusdinium trenchii TaxID=1381693 RepID=A0ABP0M2S8_9DINO